MQYVLQEGKQILGTLCPGKTAANEPSSYALLACTQFSTFSRLGTSASELLINVAVRACKTAGACNGLRVS